MFGMLGYQQCSPIRVMNTTLSLISTTKPLPMRRLKKINSMANFFHAYMQGMAVRYEPLNITKQITLISVDPQKMKEHITLRWRRKQTYTQLVKIVRGSLHQNLHVLRLTSLVNSCLRFWTWFGFHPVTPSLDFFRLWKGFPFPIPKPTFGWSQWFIVIESCCCIQCWLFKLLKALLLKLNFKHSNKPKCGLKETGMDLNYIL